MIKKVKNVVGSAVILGAGATMLGSMGQGQIASKTITPASNMLGTAATVSMGLGTMKSVMKRGK